ncbi:3-hydroxyacyl-CoA dehydrogenase NAD-binding domain-containing protein [Marinimicrobium sp. ABcell2]|uniref:3-hydroxyacyl-CoA dehydrogenase NAD-binding domain-containing protein n=1 Tax=Marinimicrobium sp. ABcell2 TaxID=3069751 RepID=UPI0027B02A1A|nr:3-hydroxyacyl-CoA dehydrogenase NAD-binding domain-containing protein [Marinimicrobium sp. ABcell2]MDQ2077773.1 3-hydroxyacyl-CoA dehydrogenase NAD-binding domain-containing protein [Marinimicrobium sp. ABcell2]
MTGKLYSALKARSVELGPFKDAPAATGHWKNWQLARDAQGVAWLLMDKKDSSVNVLSEDLLQELDEVLDSLHNDTPTALVLRSAKPGSFCVGADIKEFRHLNSEEEVASKLGAAHAVAQKLVDLPCPTVAVIHGQALGGGLELALCCDYRMAVPGSTVGLPEIMLGLHPGLGGTLRLCQLIDPLAAMTMMLTGKNTRDKKAKSLGIIDQLVEERHLDNAIEAAIEGKIKQRKSGLRSSVFNIRWVRSLAAKKMRSQAAEKAPPQHYPAPEALITLWEEQGGSARTWLQEEITSFAHLMATDTSRNLVRIFFLREKMKALAANKGSDGPTPEPIRHVHVIGAGAMGGDIAGWCAVQGLRVTLFDMQAETIAKAVGKTADLCKKKHLSKADTRDVLDRLIPDFHNIGVAQADLVLEAVPEKIDIKHKVFADIEPRMKPGAILATNTSSIPLEQLQEGLKDPSRMVGVHFFNPVALMQLVEVVEHSKASKETLARARAFVGQISRLPAPVTSAPGFLVNRALTPYLMEALVMLDEGMAAESIDQVALDFGMPMGPIELADQVGLDICLGVADMLRERLDNDMPQTPGWLSKKVDNGELGRKTDAGLYRWKDGKPDKKQDPPKAPEDTLDRLILPMLNACMACLREGVIQDADLLDGAMIFGTGFAPFRGGPMHYARNRGYSDVKASLQSLEQLHGERFAPDSGWEKEPDDD